MPFWKRRRRDDTLPATWENIENAEFGTSILMNGRLRPPTPEQRAYYEHGFRRPKKGDTAGSEKGAT